MVIQEEAHSNKDGKAPKNEDLIQREKPLDIVTGPAGQLAKVTSISDDGRVVYFKLRDGKTSWFDLPNPTEPICAVGDVLILSSEQSGQKAHVVSRELWPEELWIGVVKIKLEDITVIDSGVRFQIVPTTDDPPYELGNTVQAGDVQGITRVLSEKPIKYIDVPALDDEVTEEVVRSFLWKAPEEDKLSFDDFGGLKEVVDRVRELIEVTLQHRDKLATIGARPIKGVLFTGPPGTGKTMLAQIIASQSEVAFYKISGPEIFSKWLGESENLLRKLFQVAAKDGKAIIFFDEIDSVAVERGDTTHEASKRIVAQLLTLMDGFSSDDNVVVIAATNRPQDLDAAVRRPGRFDWEIEFPHPNEGDREDILTKKASQHRIRDPLPHGLVARHSEGWSGADLAAIWTEAGLLAVKDNRDEIREEDYIGGFERVSRYKTRMRETGSSGGS